MTPIRLQRIIAMTLVVSCFAVKGVSSSRNNPHVAEKAGDTEDDCPPCELLFSKLERTGRDGKLAQAVTVQERGEPKSGTGIMFSWAIATLMHACDYLEDLFGQGSCGVENHRDEQIDDGLFARYGNTSMVFEPALGSSDSRCSCEIIDRVSITISQSFKHTLPVLSSCAYAHGGGIGITRKQAAGNPRESPCTFADGSHVDNGDELWKCMHEANCEITDDWKQMAIFRDPRPAIVSTYFHVEVHGSKKLGDLGAFVARELPIMCQWLAVRYNLFAGFLAEQSVEYWYEDAMADPLDWHYQWYFSVGLQLPFHVVEAAAQAAAADDLGFNHKSVDKHPGEEKKAEEGVRRFEDEVSAETLELANAVLRQWLPPILLERFDIEP